MSRNKFSQTHLVLLSFKVTTFFDSAESSSGHYFEPYTGVASRCVHSWDPKMYYKDKR